MTDTFCGHNTEAKLRRSIRKMVAAIDGNSELAEALKTLVTAIDDKDHPLLRSGLNSVFEAMRDASQELIDNLPGCARSFWEYFPNFWNDLEECPPEFSQELGKTLESAFDELLSEFIDIRDGLVKGLQDRGYELANADKLDKEIDDLEELKKTVFKDWPWEERNLPPANRAMIERSRAAIARGENGIRLDELIRDMEVDSAK